MQSTTIDRAVDLLRRTAIFFVPLILSALILYLVYYVQQSNIVTALTAREATTVEVGRRQATAILAGAVADALYLARQPMLRRFLEAGDPAARQDLIADYVAFAESKPAYDQIRLIAADGRELIRVDRHETGPVPVPPDELQNKVERYYVGEGLAQDGGAVYVSPMDLNVERGAIELPIKPVIRFAAPAAPVDGGTPALVVLNFLGGPLIDGLRALDTPDGADLWLLNADGYWLIGPTADVEWAFMDPDRRDVSFATRHPHAWQAIRDGPPTGLITTDQRLTYARIDNPGSNADWILLTRAPAGAYGADQERLVRNLFTAYLVFAVLISAATALIIRLRHRQDLIGRQLSSSESRLRAVVDSTADGILITDTNGAITLANERTEAMFGHVREDLLGRHVEMLIPERFRARYATFCDSFAETPSSRKLGATLDLSGLRADGTEFPAEISFSPAETEDGLRLVLSVRDLTEQRRAQFDLEQSERWFRAMVESVPDGVVIVDDEGRIAVANAQAHALFGYRRNGLVGISIEDLVPGHLRQNHVRHRTAYQASPTSRPMGANFDLLALRGDNTEIPVEISLSPVRAEGRQRIIATVRDVTERREAAQRITDLNDRLARDNQSLNALNRELEAFSYAVSHDLRAPLRAIDGFSQALQEDCADRLDADSSRHLDRIRRAAQRMGDLIDDLLKLSRVTRSDMTVEEVDIGALANEIAGALREADPGRPVEVTIQDRLTVRGDHRLLRIALENLLGNAWKFTAGREPARIELGLATTDDGMAIRLRDNGIGFDMAYADQLFQPFRRLHDAGAFDGTGVGLATVNRVVQRHGGRIWAESEPGNGAAFFLKL